MGGVAEMAAAKAKTINLLLYEGDLTELLALRILIGILANYIPLRESQ